MDPGSGETLFTGDPADALDPEGRYASVVYPVDGNPWWRWAATFRAQVYLVGEDDPIFDLPVDKQRTSRSP